MIFVTKNGVHNLPEIADRLLGHALLRVTLLLFCLLLLVKRAEFRSAYVCKTVLKPRKHAKKQNPKSVIPTTLPNDQCSVFDRIQLVEGEVASFLAQNDAVNVLISFSLPPSPHFFLPKFHSLCNHQQPLWREAMLSLRQTTSFRNLPKNPENLRPHPFRNYIIQCNSLT